MSAGANAGNSASDAIKKAFTGVHGAGEAIRGNINAFADSITNTDSRRSQNVAERGIDEMQTGQYHGTGAGVTPTDTERERLNRDLQGKSGGVGSKLANEMNTTGTTGYSATGNASTNYGPHGSKLGNKLDPTLDADLNSHPDGRRVL